MPFEQRWSGRTADQLRNEVLAMPGEDDMGAVFKKMYLVALDGINCLAAALAVPSE